MFHSQGYQRDLMASNITSVVSTVAYQASPSMGFSRQKYWSGLPFPPPGDLPDPGIQPRSPAWQVDALPSEQPGKPLKKLGWLKFSVAFYLTLLLLLFSHKVMSNSLRPHGL